MKIRKGFVSNSSSSSYIIDGNKYTCADVAIQSVKDIFNDEYEVFDEKTTNQMIANLNKLKNKNTSIYIELYDDIYIAKDKDKIYVSATRNIDFNFDTIECADEGEFSELFEKKDFYLPKYDNKIVGKKLWRWDLNSYGYDKEDYCKCDESSVWILIKSGEVMCPSCGRKPDGKLVKLLAREQKINRITKP